MTRKITGFLIIILGLLANPWLLSIILPPADGSISLETQIIILTIETICIFFGMLFVLPKINLKKIFFTFITLLFIALTIEISLHIFFYLPISKPALYIAPSTASAVKEKPWAAEALSEYSNLTSSFAPYIGFHLNETHGKYINIDKEGMRNTWNLNFSEGESPKSIYVFGGSTILGYGARDEYTIPSYYPNYL